jgi:hypothetical protein
MVDPGSLSGTRLNYNLICAGIRHSLACILSAFSLSEDSPKWRGDGCQYAGRTLNVRDQTRHLPGGASGSGCGGEGLTRHYTKHLVANGVDANVDAMVDLMLAKSMIGPVPATAIMREIAGTKVHRWY